MLNKASKKNFLVYKIVAVESNDFKLRIVKCMDFNGRLNTVHMLNDVVKELSHF